ncbi:hypothetical protein DL240_00855 [Lujinxingia litoralis]|uniref:Uncharacterized protein n=2 Tax=Lujinxingia litoralis TaxID=2211119 RepID=A0A328C9K7_9DELT|nr:hypothetical protein DL240_00855 [Lujinxingia litoralis]
MKVITATLMACTLWGCSKTEDRVLNVVTHEIEKCRASTERFHEVKLHGDRSYQVLVEACHEPISEVEMANEWRGQVRTGPVVWMAGEDKALRAFVLNNVEWPDLDRALSMADDPKASHGTLSEAEASFAKAQQAFPKNGWVRLQRLENLIHLREKTRSGTEAPETLGEEAQAVLDEIAAWAGEAQKPEVLAGARMLALTYYEDYIRRQEGALEALGSRNPWIEAAIEQAIKDGDTKTVQEYQAELEERLEREPAEREALEVRLHKLKELRCEQASQLSVSGVEDNALREEVTQKKASITCPVPPRAEASAE